MREFVGENACERLTVKTADKRQADVQNEPSAHETANDAIEPGGGIGLAINLYYRRWLGAENRAQLLDKFVELRLVVACQRDRWRLGFSFCEEGLSHEQDQNSASYRRTGVGDDAEVGAWPDDQRRIVSQVQIDQVSGGANNAEINSGEEQHHGRNQKQAKTVGEAKRNRLDGHRPKEVEGIGIN